MPLTPGDIHEQTFRVTLRGYDANAVDKFLEQVADELNRLVEENEELKSELDDERGRRQEIEKSIAAASQIHEAVMLKAREESRAMVLSSQRTAEEIVAEARRKAQDILSDATRRATDLQGELRAKSSAFRVSLEAIREKRIGMLSDLAGMAETLRQWVDRQPDEPSVDTAKALEEALGALELDEDELAARLDELEIPADEDEANLETVEEEDALTGVDEIAAEVVEVEGEKEAGPSFRLAASEAEESEAQGGEEAAEKGKGFSFTFGRDRS